MIRERIDRFWHGTLQRPYRLSIGIDQFGGDGGEVVLLHGIGSSTAAWRFLASELQKTPCHVMAFDLLGFGNSPKPDWPDYTVDDHARAVIASIERHRRIHQPVIIVGHSMGCLVAVRVAYLRPDLVARLLLYQMPLYSGLPTKRHYDVRRDIYYKLYTYLIERPPLLSPSRLRQAIMKRTGLQLEPDTLQPFMKSLYHTIMEQHTLQDMRKLRMPIIVVYGSLDMVVIRGRPKDIFKEIAAPLQVRTIAQMHGISKRASRFLAIQIRLLLTTN